MSKYVIKHISGVYVRKTSYGWGWTMIQSPKIGRHVFVDKEAAISVSCMFFAGISVVKLKPRAKYRVWNPLNGWLHTIKDSKGQDRLYYSRSTVGPSAEFSKVRAVGLLNKHCPQEGQLYKICSC